jgi:TFIIF-interacting CTD phosphatase-like protein
VCLSLSISLAAIYAYSIQLLVSSVAANALPIEGWTSDPNDEALLDALPILDSLRFTSDVRKVLGIRGF